MPRTNRQKAAFGIMGLGVMGENLALNVEEHGFPVALWNRNAETTRRVVARHAGRRWLGAKSLEEFVGFLERPRRILMMIKAGAPVDQMLRSLEPLLGTGDIVIDGGNSFYLDTRRREEEMQTSGIHFFGVGVSGGERGARFGPSLMPGGDREAYRHLHPILETIAAKTDSGACVTWLGPDGAGHFVKMVHNGIEYGDMQVIAEAYDILRRAAGLGAEELAGIFAEWNRGPLESFLIDLTARILEVRDAATGRPLVDVVLDSAGQKGTGEWTAEAALQLGVPIPTVAAAIDARLMSGLKGERVEASASAGSPAREPGTGLGDDLIAAVHDALYAARVCTYAQGMALIRAGSVEMGWGIDPGEVARIWKGGCIIRANLLDEIMRAYGRRPDLANLLVDEGVRAEVEASQTGWRRAVGIAVERGIPVPAISASLAYFDGYRTADLPQNLTQAQRDAFGSHTYQRADRPGEGFVHTDWLGAVEDSEGET